MGPRRGVDMCSFLTHFIVGVLLLILSTNLLVYRERLSGDDKTARVFRLFGISRSGAQDSHTIVLTYKRARVLRHT